jgi:hypothetical protein
MEKYSTSNLLDYYDAILNLKSYKHNDKEKIDPIKIMQKTRWELMRLLKWVSGQINVLVFIQI